MIGIQTQTYTDAADLPSEMADLAAASTTLYVGTAWLALEDQAHPGGHFHVTAQGHSGSALASCYEFDRDSNPWPAARLDLFATEFGGLRDVDNSPDQLLPAVLIGGRRPGHSRLLVSAGADRSRFLRALIAEAAERSRERGASCLAALYVDADDAELNQAFAAAGAVSLASPANNVLDLPGDADEDWLASLGKKRRGNVLADRRKLADAGVEVQVRSLTSADVDDVVELEMRNYRKYGHDYDAVEAEALHRAYLSHLDDDQALIGRAEVGGRLTGFVSLVRHGETLHARQAGFDPELSDGLPVYMGVVFDAPVAWAYANGVRRIDLSISADKTKERKGATQQPRRAWVLPLRGQSINSLDAAR